MSRVEDSVQQRKAELRRSVWSKLERMEVAISPRPCYGKIPSFVGIHSATQRLIKTDVYRNARVVYSTPDTSTRLLREETLRRGKTLVVSIPGLKGYVIVRPDELEPGDVRLASSVKGAVTKGDRITLLEGLKIDLVVLGSVAVNTDGARLGRGDGMHDLEYALLREMYAVAESTPVATLVHDLQILEEPIPMLMHDVPIDYIASPYRLITVERKHRKPPGVIWEMLPIDFIKSTPILRRLFGI
ncbi:5-formyltetrahydrofolate cyclo-ligase [Thermofilum pendens]|uniref:5-formyltetrahydrofolate cyclo-ligase n=1 Tax=Thermofilum pendens (strain DSM 2475 / Hrk 5) TaxID=368408 RepID=A1RWD1_THEPD|nr:5-formyltetrahydrofolate cyclo-ligase [Thermofilum pendens]ABL77511.1 5-formyltetrahydrofolate cyclo-ligase [Thermofilum pendens Hrk 5]